MLIYDFCLKPDKYDVVLSKYLNLYMIEAWMATDTVPQPFQRSVCDPNTGVDLL